MKIGNWLMALVVVLLPLSFSMQTYGSEEKTAPRINIEELRDLLSNEDLVLLDVRTKKDWKKSDRKIVGAVRVNPKKVESWAGNYPKEKKIVLYCA